MASARGMLVGSSMKNTLGLPVLALALGGALANGCGDEEAASTDAGSDSGAGDAAGESPPSDFHDCSDPPCRVSLDAFTKMPGTTPYCEPSKPAVPFVCGGEVHAGTCDGLYSLRYVYGFPGDYFQCVYDGAGTLVGAIWTPDNHPQQVAGTVPPPGCALDEDPCLPGDGGGSS